MKNWIFKEFKEGRKLETEHEKLRQQIQNKLKNGPSNPTTLISILVKMNWTCKLKDWNFQGWLKNTMT